MRVPSEKSEIRHSVQRYPSAEHIRVAERSEHGKSACRSSRDRNSFRVDVFLCDEMFDGRDRILDIDDTPISAQSLPEGSSIPSTSSVVDVDVGESSSGEILNAEVETSFRRRGRTTVTVNDELSWKVAREK